MESELSEVKLSHLHETSANNPSKMTKSSFDNEELLWCTDLEFDTRVNDLSIKAVLDLVQALQETMVLEQQTFDSLRQQLAHASTESEAHERLSTALCSSQARLARLCARNMRCFMQAVRAKQTFNDSPPGEAPLRDSLTGRGGSEDDTCTEEGEEEEEEGSEEGSGSSGFHSLPRAPRKVSTDAERVPSVDQILCSVKKLRNNHNTMVKSALKVNPPTENKSFLHGHMMAANVLVEENSSPLYENVVINGANKIGSPVGLIYENLTATNSTSTHIYDKPRTNIYDTPNVVPEDEAVYENVNFSTGKQSSDNELSDEDVYENVSSFNKKQISVIKNEEVMYDVPQNSTPIYATVNTSEKKIEKSAKNCLDITSLVPQSTRMLLNGRHHTKTFTSETNSKDIDADSLEEISQQAIEVGSRSDDEDDEGSEPDIPSPDYGSEEGDEEGEFCCDEMPGLQDDTDARGYYSEDQGLAVILEEPEEEDRSSSAASDSSSGGRPDSASSLNDSGVVTESNGVAAATEQDRVLDAYKETVRQRFARTKQTLENEESSGPNGEQPTQESCDEKRISSVRDLRSRFESHGPNKPANAMLKLDRLSSNGTESGIESNSDEPGALVDTVDSKQEVISNEEEVEFVEPILAQFSEVDEGEEIRKPRPTTRSWDPSLLLKRLYALPESFRASSPATTKCVTIEGYLEKLPSGKKKATFWNAWKRRYFRAKDGFLYYYQHNQSDKPSMTMQLMGGKVDSLETTILGVEDRQPVVSTMLGIDDGKGHYVVVRCATKQETERWRLALLTHIAENICSTYVHPWPIPKDPALIKDTIIIDLGSCSIRAGVLCTQPSLPHLFLPTIMAVDKISKKRTYGSDALKPEIRSTSTLHYPVKPSAKITKYSVDIPAVIGFLQKIFQDLNVDQKLYDVILSVPRNFNSSTQTEIVNVLFDKFEVRAVNMTHQSVLALYAYNTTSGIVVDIGERMDIVPINDGYIVENGVSRIPYGGNQIVDHLRHFLMQKQYSLVTEVESFLIRYSLENLCYCAKNYNQELNKCRQDPELYEKTLSIKEFFADPQSHWESINLDSGCFQPTEGLFSPEAWGLDNAGIHKLVHRAIQECSMDARKEMTRSIYLSGGVTLLPGFAERLHSEIDKLTPPTVTPRVHASPYRYHAAYLGACVLANSPGVDQLKITMEEWNRSGNSALKKWNL